MIVICGPIASGKSTLARAVVRNLSARGVASAAIDLDHVYEMLEPGRGPKDDASTWSRARRIAARLVDALFGEGVEAAVAEGDFLDAGERTEFVSALGTRPQLRFVTLDAPVAVALARVAGDPSRGISRDPVFLARHYEDVGPLIRSGPESDLRLDTSTVSVDEAADAVVAWSLAATTQRA